MRFDSAFIADGASPDGGLLTVYGGWGEVLNFPALGAPASFWVVVVLELDPGEEETSFPIDLTFRMDGREEQVGVLDVCRPPAAEPVPDAPLYAHSKFEVRLQADRVGPCEIDIEYHGVVFRTIRFVARVKSKAGREVAAPRPDNPVT